MRMSRVIRPKMGRSLSLLCCSWMFHVFFCFWSMEQFVDIVDWILVLQQCSVPGLWHRPTGTVSWLHCRHRFVKKKNKKKQRYDGDKMNVDGKWWVHEPPPHPLRTVWLPTHSPTHVPPSHLLFFLWYYNLFSLKHLSFLLFLHLTSPLFCIRYLCNAVSVSSFSEAAVGMM